MASHVPSTVVACLLAIGCSRADQASPGATESSTGPEASAKPAEGRRRPGKRRPVAPLAYEQRLAEIDRSIGNALRLTEKNRSSLGFTRAAEQTLLRAHLTGSYDDYAQAEVLVDRAFGIVIPGVGPYMTRARLDFELRRLDRVDVDFERHRRQIGKSGKEKAADALFAAELALLRGRYDEAEAGHRAALEVDETPDALRRLAVLRWRTGAFDEAEALVGRALAIEPPAKAELAAELHVMLGRMDLERGRYDDALAHLHDAGAHLRGYWLVEQHAAEALALRGDAAGAEALYAQILARGERPELLDALAELHRARGNERGADVLVERARRCHEERLARFPGVASGHALEHFLDHGNDPERTLRLAEAHHAVQPNAEAKLLLARAHLAAGDSRRAEEVLAEAAATPWSTVGFHLTAAEVFRAAGNEARAGEQLARADAINPRLATAHDAPLPWADGAFQ